MNKRTIMIGAIGGMIIGGATPLAFGNYNPFGFWAVFGGLIGGIVGICLAVYCSKRFGF